MSIEQGGVRNGVKAGPLFGVPMSAFAGCGHAARDHLTSNPEWWRYAFGASPFRGKGPQGALGRRSCVLGFAVA
jgi:hypothetical protein